MTQNKAIFNKNIMEKQTKISEQTPQFSLNDFFAL